MWWSSEDIKRLFRLSTLFSDVEYYGRAAAVILCNELIFLFCWFSLNSQKTFQTAIKKQIQRRRKEIADSRWNQGCLFAGSKLFTST